MAPCLIALTRPTREHAPAAARYPTLVTTILAIESSCDETAAAVVVDGRRARSNIVASQTDLHAETGGVVPEVAARQHLRALLPVVPAPSPRPSAPGTASTPSPPPPGPASPARSSSASNAARGIAYARGLPFIPTDHIEGHVCANWLGPDEPPLPALALAVSGGHTELLLMRDHADFERLGGTRDDAAGEAFDKVARLLDLGYPGGPPLSALAATATDRTLKLPRAWLRGSDDYSFSGLKTAVAQLLAGHGRSHPVPPPAEVAWAFEESVVDVLSRKAARVRRARRRRLAAARRRRRRQPPPPRGRTRALARPRLHPPARALH